VRRSIAPMLMAAATLSTRLASQSSVVLGFAGTLGSSWQIEAGEVGYLRGLHAGPLRSVMLGARLGSFIDEGAIIGGTRGFIGGGVLAVRTGVARLADVGNETSPSPFGLDLTIELAGYAGAKSPLPQGSAWAAASVLPGVRFGGGDGPRYGLVVGPTVFFGPGPGQWRALLALRFELPLARAKRHP